MRTSCIVCLLSCIPAAVSQVGNTNPTYMPNSGFPGQTEAETNALWPSGKQPPRLAEWPQTAPDPTTGEPTLLECWEVKVLRDYKSGWPGMCQGLFRQPQFSDEATCQSSCIKEARCPMWQYVTQETPGQCWHGYGSMCQDKASSNQYIQIGGAQRLQHGEVRVLASVANFEILNMYLLGVLAGCQGQECIDRCRDWCYSDIGCQYWQYGANGCYVDAPYKTWPNQVQYPLTASGISTTSTAAHTMVAGEYIQHYCPPQSTPLTAAPTAAPIAAPLPTLSPTLMPTSPPTPLPTMVPAIKTLSFTPAPTSFPTIPPTLMPTLMPTLQPTLAPTSKSGSSSSGGSGSGKSGDSGTSESSSGSADSGPSDIGSGDSSASGSSGSGTSGESSGSGSSGIEWWLWVLLALLLLMLFALCAGLLFFTMKPKKKKKTRAMEFREERGPLMMQQQPAPEPMYIQPPPPMMYSSPPSPVQQQTLVAPPLYVAAPTTTYAAPPTTVVAAPPTTVVAAPPTTIVAAPPTTTYAAASRAVVMPEVSRAAPVYAAPTTTLTEPIATGQMYRTEPIATGQMYPTMQPRFMQ